MPDKYTKSKIKNDQDAKRILNRALFAIHNNDKDISKRGAGLYIQGYNNPKNVLGLSGRPEIHTIDSLYQTDSIGNAQKILQYMHDKKLGAPNTSIIHPEYLLDEGVTNRMREFYNVGKNLGLNENVISALMALSYGETLYNNDLNNLFSYKKTQMPTIKGDDRIINYGLFSLENLKKATPEEKKTTGKNYIENPNMPYGKYKTYLKENKLKDSIESQINYYINQYLPSKDKSFKIEDLNNKDINSVVEYLFKMQGTKFDPKQTTTMKKRAEFFRNSKFENGGKMSIHIKPENKGKFNATKKRTGKTTEELTHSKNPLTRKRAIFAQNAKKWKHANGGELLGLDYYTNQLDEGGPLNSPMVSRSIINPNLTAQSSEPVMTLTQQKVNPIIGINLSGIDPLSTVSDVATLFSSPDITSQGENQQANVDEENNFDPTYIDVSQVKKDFNTKQAIGSSVGAGAGLGATVGSIVPGIGTVVGGAVGAVGGAIAGGIKSIFGKKKAKRKEKRAKNKARGLNSMATLESYMGKAYGFAEGGNLSNLMGRKYFAEGGLTTFNNGGSHEESPIGGIPQGMSETGQMNLVEEGETRFQDYIFSDRLLVHKEIAEQMNLPKNIIGKTFAEASEILGKDLEEHPNDPISERGFEEMMTRLMAANNMTKDLKDADEQANVFAEGGDLGDPNQPTGIVKESEEATENMGRDLKPVTDEEVKKIAESDIKKEKIPGGRSDSEVREKATELYDPMEISVGIKVEMEHTNSIEAAREIALDHLVENRDYYTRLYHIGLIDEDITEEEEQFLKDKWVQIESAEELSSEEQPIDQPIDESVLEQPNEALNEIPMDQPQMEEQQFASGGSLDGGYAKNNPFGTALYRKGWAHPFRRKPEGINPNNSIIGEATSYPIPPERQLFTLPDITGGYDQSDPMFYLRNNERRTPPVIKGGEDEVSTTKASPKTTAKVIKNEISPMTTLPYSGEVPTLNPILKEPELAKARTQTYPNEEPSSWEDYLSLLQYAPVLGNLIGAATVGKAERINPARITPQQLNDYLQYNPIDPNTYMNPILAQAANARRAMADASGGSRASILAANLGLNAQSQNAISQAALQAEAINEQRRLQSAEFNRGTNQFNASERARAEQFNASAKMQADDINARNRAARRKAIRGYLTGAAQGLGGIGREQAYRNTIKTMGLDYYLDALSKVKYKKS